MRDILRIQRLMLPLAAALLLGGCAFAPGSHMDYQTETAPIDDLVDIEPITPGLLATWQSPQGAQPISDELQAKLEAYEYRVGPGDVLSIIVYDHPELTNPGGTDRSAAEVGNLVQANGTFFYPYIGRVNAEGKTLDQIRNELSRRLATFITEPQVEVSVAAYNAKKVYLSGEVSQPKTLPITSVPLTLVDAISQVGSANPGANWHSVFLNRNGQQEQISLYALMRNGDMSQNRLLQTGDILHVPSAENQAVSVMGQVNRPGSIPLGNERMTLTDAISRSGGIDERSADPSGIFVIRGQQAPSAKLATVYQLDVTNAASFTLGNRFTLQPQDVVYVTTAPIARWNRVISLLLPSISLPGTAVGAVDDVRDINN
ncbi:MAG: polysaccharide export protein [Halomonas sp.]|uniref:polysaccharide export protein n=1 Tax=Halomonas sp. TaxID=1486246 RepID=UPI002ACE25D2|nr:polysaccharide export protein [Halomonas sp.]MDZ7852539.1 polysaccharide export protein [Halomonas sp.]